jgi:hypothetical protein
MNFAESCRENNKDVLNRYINEHEDFNISVEVNNLMVQNELDIIKWLYSIDPRIISTIKKNTVLDIVKNRHFELLEWLQEKNTIIHTIIWNIIKEIMRSGDLGLLDHLVRHMPFSKKMITLRIIPVTIELVQNNQLEILKWLDVHFINIIYTFNNYELYRIAFENNHDELLDWLILKNPPALYGFDVKPIFIKACVSGNIKLAKLLYHRYSISIQEIHSQIVLNCSVQGKLDVLKWLYSIYTDYDFNGMFINASMNGHINVLQWLLYLEHIDKNIILDSFRNACLKNDTRIITFLLYNCHRSLATRNILNYIFDLINRFNDTKAIDIILDTIYLRTELDTIFMVFHKDYCIAKHILSRFFDLQLDYTLLFKYYVSQQYNDLCVIIVKHHLEQLVLSDTDIIQMISNIVFGLNYDKNIEMLDLLYLVNPNCFYTIRDTLFNNVCERNFLEVALWLVSVYPDRFVVIIEDHTILEYYIIKILFRSGVSEVQMIEQCSICMIVDSDILTNCRHQFCYQCINYWYRTKTTCPICRSELSSCSQLELASPTLPEN